MKSAFFQGLLLLLLLFTGSSLFSSNDDFWNLNEEFTLHQELKEIQFQSEKDLLVFDIYFENNNEPKKDQGEKLYFSENEEEDDRILSIKSVLQPSKIVNSTAPSILSKNLSNNLKRSRKHCSSQKKRDSEIMLLIQVFRL